MIDRRRWLSGMAAAAAGALLAGCDKLTMNPVVQQGLAMAEGLTRRAQVGQDQQGDGRHPYPLA